MVTKKSEEALKNCLSSLLKLYRCGQKEHMKRCHMVFLWFGKSNKVIPKNFTFFNKNMNASEEIKIEYGNALFIAAFFCVCLFMCYLFLEFLLFIKKSCHIPSYVSNYKKID